MKISIRGDSLRGGRRLLVVFVFFSRYFHFVDVERLYLLLTSEYYEYGWLISEHNVGGNYFPMGWGGGAGCFFLILMGCHLA
jgi:hypothetical protein